MCTALCAMDPMTAIAASGLRARMESLDMLANNIANASTGGYKADREFYSLYVGAGSRRTPAILHHAGHRTALDRSCRRARCTRPATSRRGALDGKGFFRRERARAGRSTRATAAFTCPPAASWSPPTATRSGRGRRGADRSMLRCPIDISEDGTVQQDGQVIGQTGRRRLRRARRGWPNKAATTFASPTRRRSPRRPPAPRSNRANWKLPTPAPPNRPCGWSASCASSKCCRRPCRSATT